MNRRQPIIDPPPPPTSLSNEEAAIWREVTGTVRPDWFKGSETMLATFVRVAAVERRLAAMLRDADPMEEDFAALVRLHRAQALAVAAIAVKLRLTVRSTRDASTTKLPRGASVEGNGASELEALS